MINLQRRCKVSIQIRGLLSRFCRHHVRNDGFNDLGGGAHAGEGHLDTEVEEGEVEFCREATGEDSGVEGWV